jgi:hypothetical protein
MVQVVAILEIPEGTVAGLDQQQDVMNGLWCRGRFCQGWREYDGEPEINQVLSTVIPDHHAVFLILIPGRTRRMEDV